MRTKYAMCFRLSDNVPHPVFGIFLNYLCREEKGSGQRWYSPSCFNKSLRFSLITLEIIPLLSHFFHVPPVLEARSSLVILWRTKMTLLYFHDKYEYMWNFIFEGVYCLQWTFDWENVTLKFENSVSNKKKIQILCAECVNQCI